MAGLEISEDLDLSGLNQKEKIVLLDKVFFKILSSESDLDFEMNLDVFLPKLLLKLGTTEDVVRKKIMEILVHVNKRIKSRPDVQLPLDNLLDIFNESAKANLSFVTNFSLIYIKLAFPRLPDNQKADMIGKILPCLDGKSLAHQDSILSLIVSGLRHLELKPNEEINKQKYGFQQQPKLKKSFLDYLYYFLLLPYAPNKQPTTAAASNPPATALTNLSISPPPAPAANPTPEIPACLSESIYKRFKTDVDLENGDELEKIKIGILKFLALNIYDCEDILFHYIISTSDTRYAVVEMAELHIKRIVGGVDLNSQVIVSKFFQIFLGDVKSMPLKKPANDADVTQPANTRIRLKLFPYILRSRQASCTIPQSLQLVFDGLFGPTYSTNNKIKLYSVQFVHMIALNCETDKLSKVGAVLIQGMNKVIANAKDDGKIRGLAYVAVGKLARKIPNTISTDISIVHSFFSALASEELDIKMHIQEALVLMIDAFRKSKDDQKNLLLTLLFQYIENDVSQCRAMAVKYAFEIYEQDQLESRYLLLLASSDPKEEIRQEAGKYLRRTQDADGNNLKMGTFDQWVEFIAQKSEERLRTKYKNYTFGTHTLAFEPNCYEEILVILRMALSTSANLKPQIIEPKALESIRDDACLIVNYVTKLGAENLNTLFKYVNIVKEYALTVANALGIYLLLEICSIAPLNITQILYENLEWLKTQSFNVNEQVRTFAAELWSLVLINNLISQQPDMNTASFDKLFSEVGSIRERILLNPAKSYETKHGGVLCIGYALGRFLAIKKTVPDSDLKYDLKLKEQTLTIMSVMDDPNLSTAAIVAFGEMARNGFIIYDSRESKLNIVSILIKKIQTSKETNKLKERAAATLGYLCLHEEINENDDYIYETKHLNTFSKYVMQMLLNSSQAKQIELHMSIGEALANCALGKRSLSCLNTWKVNLKDELSVANLIGNETSENMEWLLKELLSKYIPSPNQHLRQAACFWLLIFIKKCAKAGPVVMDNLLRIQETFISRLGENDEVTQEVASKGIGIIFSLASEEQKKILVDRLVGTLSGGNNKSKKNPSTAVNLTSVESGIKIEDENAEIFGAEIGKAPDGSNIGSYKELCSLASDMNKPDLIYQFMNLAHHNSIWNTRRGAAFGFNTISELASEQLQPHLKEIVPKLFRYQFDPNPKIQQSMTSIWDSLIAKENKKIIDVYLEEILVEIEKNMLSNLWRVRESCCNALCDLLKGGRNLEAISGRFGPFWTLLFKLADDIKESVRTSAAFALKSLQRVTISYSTSVSNKKICEQTIDSVLPILIKTGLQSSIEEIRNISVLTIRDLAKQSSSFLIKPYLIDLIISLLETLSGYEPPDLNYIALKLNSQDAQEKLDMARIAASKNTPMVEIINMNIQYLNEDSIIAELIPKLIEIIKRGLGVSTKAGVCHIICALVDEQPNKMTAFSGKIMAVLVNSMSTENNKTINKSYCATIGSISKVAKESSIENLLNKLQEWYFEKDDAGIKQSCGLTLFAIIQNNIHLMTKYSKRYIPFTFFAMHQQTESQMKLKQKQLEYEQKTQFKTDFETRSQMPQMPNNTVQTVSIWVELWEEITSGTEYAIKANLSEILGFIRQGLDHKSWDMRVQSALAICTICTKLQSNIDSEHLNELLSILISALTTRTWNGKDKVLIAVSCLFSNCKLILKFENNLVEEIFKSIFKEANKQSSNIDLSYRTCALRCLTDLISFSSVNFADSNFEQYWSMFFQVYFEQVLESVKAKEAVRFQQQVDSLTDKKVEDDTKSDVEMVEGQEKVESEVENVKSEPMEEEPTEDPALEKLRVVFLETIGKCWPYSNEMQEKYLFDAVLIISDSLGKLEWTNQLQIIKSLSTMFDKWSIELEETNFESNIRSIELTISSVISCIARTKYSVLRREGLAVLDKVFNLLKIEVANTEKWSLLVNASEPPIRKLLFDKITENLRVLFEDFMTDSNMDIREKSKTLLKGLNALL